MMKPEDMHNEAMRILDEMHLPADKYNAGPIIAGLERVANRASIERAEDISKLVATYTTSIHNAGKESEG